MLRLTVTGYGIALVLPADGATAATVTYGALGLLFSGSLIYMLLNGDLGSTDAIASVF